MECFLKSKYNQCNLEFGKFHSNNSIILKYTDESPYDCVLCQRKHINNTNRPIIYKFLNGDIFFQCRVGKKVIIGNDKPLKSCQLNDEIFSCDKTKIDEEYVNKRFTCISPEFKKRVICDKEDLIEYLNKYLTYIIGTKKPVIIETNFKNNTHILRTTTDSYARFTSIKLAYDFWVKSD